jgi:hypothetical protein
MTRLAPRSTNEKRLIELMPRAGAARLGPDAEQSRHALESLGERESGTARLEEAVAAYRDALKEWTRERGPLDWATSFGSQGVALMLLAERMKDAPMAQTAVLQIEAAFKTLRDGGHAPFAAYMRPTCPRLGVSVTLSRDHLDSERARVEQERQTGGRVSGADLRRRRQTRAHIQAD